MVNVICLQYFSDASKSIIIAYIVIKNFTKLKMIVQNTKSHRPIVLQLKLNTAHT